MSDELTNSQVILIAELEEAIKKLKDEGAEYPAIKGKCMKIAESHWLVKHKYLQEQALAVALHMYALTDEQKEAQAKLREITGVSIF